jgi:hypothetical protein
MASDAPPASTNPAPMILGIISTILGVIGSILSFIPCLFILGMPIGGFGLLLGGIGLIVALVTKQGMVLPIIGSLFCVLSLVIGGIWIGIGAYVGNEANKEMEADRKAVREAAAPVKITAVELAKQYSGNRAGADATYKGKVLEITGEVFTVEKPGLYPVVQLKTADPLRQIACNFEKDQSTPALALTPGKNVTIRGKFEGELILEYKLAYCIVK